MSDIADRKQQEVADRRLADREAIQGAVRVCFADLELVGPGRNISETGVYFVADATARVQVIVDGVLREAEVVRVESLGNGKTGVAVRFVDELQG